MVALASGAAQLWLGNRQQPLGTPVVGSFAAPGSATRRTAPAANKGRSASTSSRTPKIAPIAPKIARVFIFLMGTRVVSWCGGTEPLRRAALRAIFATPARNTAGEEGDEGGD